MASFVIYFAKDKTINVEINLVLEQLFLELLECY